MRLLNFLILLFLLFCFITCHVDSRLKKIPPEMKVIKNIESTYNPSVDILFIIDDSGSMTSIQGVLAKNAKVFVSHFLDVSFINYHVGVTTSSIGSDSSLAGGGRLNRCRELEKYGKSYKYSVYVDKKTYKAGDCLREMLKVGDDGDDTEYFLNIPELVFSEDLQDHNAGFYRPDAHLAVFIITDTDDYSTADVSDAYKFLLSLKGGDENKLHYALGHVIFPRKYTCTREGPPGDRKLKETVGLFGPRGYEFDICQFDYGKHLAKFATHLVQSVSTISLDSVPDISSIEVYYEYAGGGVQNIPNGSQGWSYDVDNNAINLSPDIQLDSGEGKFRIRYQVLYTSERR